MPGSHGLRGAHSTGSPGQASGWEEVGRRAPACSCQSQQCDLGWSRESRCGFQARWRLSGLEASRSKERQQLPWQPGSEVWLWESLLNLRLFLQPLHK